MGLGPIGEEAEPVTVLHVLQTAPLQCSELQLRRLSRSIATGYSNFIRLTV